MDEIATAYKGPKDAFTRGNYEMALKMGVQGAKNSVVAAARIMLGLVETQPEADDRNGSGLATWPYAAYAAWCREDHDAALSILSQHPKPQLDDQAKRLARLINTDSFYVIVFYDENTASAVPTGDLPGIRVQAINCGELDAKLPLLESLERWNCTPDLILVCNQFGGSLPPDIFDLGIPVALISNDFDQSLAAQFDDLVRADLVIVETAYEAYAIEQICNVRTTSFHGFCYSDPPNTPAPVTDDKTLDIGFSGTAFARHWRDRARLLFRLATLDDPTLAIRIHDGYLEKAEYSKLYRESKFIPLTNRYPFSPRQVRTLDCLQMGSLGLRGEGIDPKHIIDRADRQFFPVTDAELELEVCTYLGRFNELWTNYKFDRDEIWQAFRDCYWSGPKKHLRLLRFALFQCLVLAPRFDQQKLRRNVVNSSESTPAAKAFRLFLDRPLDREIRRRTKECLQLECEVNPTAPVASLNLGRFCWMTEDRAAARDAFQRVINDAESGLFNPLTDTIHAHLVRAFAEMLPYQEYYQATIQALLTGDENFSVARRILAATATTYLGLDHLQNNRPEQGLGTLNAALDLFEDHDAAARLATKAAAAAVRPGPEVLSLFNLSVALYPPVITELLPIGLWAHETLNDHDAALALARRWAYFITRVEWSSPSAHEIPSETWLAIERYSSRFPPTLQEAVHQRSKACGREFGNVAENDQT